MPRDGVVAREAGTGAFPTAAVVTEVTILAAPEVDTTLSGSEAAASVLSPVGSVRLTVVFIS